jgi:Family of unknown function (DUF5762)
MPTKFWLEDGRELYAERNYLEIIPMGNMSLEAQLNAVFRFFIYLGVVLALIMGNYRYLFMPIFAALITVLLYEYEKVKRQRAERFLRENELDVVQDTVCQRSTVENPFMNPSIADITDNPERPSACRVSRPEVQEVIQKNFNARYYQDVNDVFGKFASQREFYTMPNTQIPNDRESFAKWCYGLGKTCKEGNGLQCWELQTQRKTMDYQKNSPHSYYTGSGGQEGIVMGDEGRISNWE